VELYQIDMEIKLVVYLRLLIFVGEFINEDYPHPFFINLASSSLWLSDMGSNYRFQLRWSPHGNRYVLLWEVVEPIILGYSDISKLGILEIGFPIIRGIEEIVPLVLESEVGHGPLAHDIEVPELNVSVNWQERIPNRFDLHFVPRISYG